jgi:multiple sugar transport system permease protein
MTAVAPAPVRPARARRTGVGRARGRGRVGWAFMAPFAVVFAFAFLAPLAYAMYLSLFRDQMVGGRVFVGLANYAAVFNDPQFWTAFGRVAIFLAVQVPIMLAISLFSALALDSGRLYGSRFFRIAIFLPYAVPAVVATLMWGFMYGRQFGLVGSINSYLGTSIPDPLAPDLVLAAIGNIVTWEFIGYNMLIFYAALRVIPGSLYEAAKIDGAGEIRTVWSIKLPAIRGALVIATVFSIIGSFQLFNEPSVLRNLAPNAITTSYTPNLYAYSLSFAGQRLTYSATVAIVMGVATMILAYLVQLRGMRKV